MRKLLLSSLLAVATLGSYAVENNFSYCISDGIYGLSVQRPALYGEAILLPANLQKGYGDGASITQITAALGKTSVKDVTLFITHELGKEPVYTQAAVLTSEAYATVDLTTPFELDGEDVYVGFFSEGLTAQDGPITVDYSPYDFEGGAYYTAGTTEEDLAKEWGVLSGFGNCCIRVTIDTPAEVNNFIFPMILNFREYARVNEEFSGNILVQNLGSNEVSSVEMEVNIGDEETLVGQYTYNEQPVQAHSFAILGVDNLKTSIYGTRDVTVNIAKVNGVDNSYPNAALTTEIRFVDDFFIPTAVIEEGTGTTCGFCPMGYVGMEKMNEEHNDGTYIGIAAHTYSNQDLMYCASYQMPMNNLIGNNYPNAVVNRRQSFQPEAELCESAYNYIQSLCTLQKIDLKAQYTSLAYDKLIVECEITSLEDLDQHKFGIALVTTENEVGPYAQDNYFAGGRYGEMGGFEKKPAVVNLIFNDVARLIVNAYGNTSVVPSTLSSESPNVCQKMEIATTGIADLKNAYLTALLIDTSTTGPNQGAIINAARIKLPEAIEENVDPAGVAAVGADSGETEYFTLDGIRVTTPTLAPGLYIKREGSKATKILVD